MRRSAGSAREKNSRGGGRVFSLPALSSHRRPAVAGPTLDGKCETIGQKAEVPDTYKAFGQHVQKEPTQELGGS